ncbi:hypothetical protein AAH979_38320 [Plantactinospora sp. ZYX-F-223]|uniref:hypothetical protein n=1 Tax=Plantactinospora sp. ZYX-F-223 TaxID=3144103 RepID=UPI0031FCCF6C
MNSVKPAAARPRDSLDVDPGVLRSACTQLGFDPDDGERVSDLAAVAVTRMAWRDGPVEDWHSVRFRRISDGEMMRASAAATRLVRSVLRDQQSYLYAGSDPFRRVFQTLADPDRMLPDGRRLIDLAPDAVELTRLRTHVELCCSAWADSAAVRGLGKILLLLACRGAVFNWRWWLSTGWPRLVETFVRRIDDPTLWRNPWEINNRRRIGDPPDGLTGTNLRQLLLAGPDPLTATAAAYCLKAGLSALPPQDCGLPPVRRRLLPAGYLGLVEEPSGDPTLITG